MWVEFKDYRLDRIWDEVSAHKRKALTYDDEETMVSMECAKLTERKLERWGDSIPHKFVDNRIKVYNKDGKEIFLESVTDGSFVFVKKENGMEKRSGVFFLRLYCFPYSKY